MTKTAGKRNLQISAEEVVPGLQQQDGSDLMQALLAKEKGALPAPIFGVAVANIRAALSDGCFRLDIPALAMPSVDARVACALDGLTPGTAVAVMFEGGDVNRALIIGPMYCGNDANIEASGAETEVVVDHQRIVIEAGQELELRCGEAAIILTADGRILQRGTYISSHASATQRIRGGSVQIN